MKSISILEFRTASASRDDFEWKRSLQKAKKVGMRIGMKYPSDSALQNHYLDSILPHPCYPESKQFLKNKDFYHPESFIWNNPHRTSDKIYKFYHAVNEHYQQHQQPILRRQIEQHKQAAQIQRIQFLIAFRNMQRQKFLNNKQRREHIQAKLRKSSIKSIASVVSQQYGLVPSAYQSTFKSKSIESSTHKHKQTDSVANLKLSYANSLKNYDSKTNEIIDLISNQKEQYHNKVRADFKSRQKVNLSKNDRLPNSSNNEGIS